MLDISVVNMTTAQSLFFYRNIAYIERNSGKREIFDWLVQNVMTVRGLPIAEYVMKHSTENQLQSLKPDLLFQKRPLNSLYGKDKATIFSLDQIVSKEDTIAPGNAKYRVDEIDNIHEVMENSVSNVVLTKLLESSVIDDSNSASYNLNDILLNHWIYLSSVGIYKAFVTIKNPKTGEALSLSAAEAFVLAWYAFCNSININPPTIPKIFAKKVQRVISPAALNHKGIVSNVADIDDIMSIADSKLVPRSIAEQALSMQPEIDQVISTQAFYELCVEIFNAGQMQWGLICSQQHSVGRAMTHAMVSRIYSDNVCTFTDGEVTYSDWFAARNIDIAGVTQAELGALYINLVNQATGLALNKSISFIL
ncbi:MAG: Virion structural protein, partial [uncultured bacterium]